jgi:hypothetical protein
MYERIDPFSLHNYDLRRSRFDFELSNWINILTQNKIELVISPSIPHRLFDFTLYLACKLLKVKFLTFQMTPFGSNIIPLELIERIECDNLNSESELFEIIQDKIASNKGHYKDAEPEYMKKHKENRKFNSILKSKVQKFTRNLSKENWYKFKKPNSYLVPIWSGDAGLSWTEHALYGIKKYLKLTKLKKYYDLVSCQSKDLKSNSYVLIALHYQPEETSCPSGFKYADQLRLIKKLRYLLDDNISLYVKEHGAQFDLHQEGNVARNKDYYNDILALKNTYLIDTKENIFDLIDKSLFVVTLTGTIGWEAALRIKPVLHLGRAWYEGAPYTFRANTDEDIIQFITNLDDISFSSKEIQEWHRTFANKLLTAKHYKFSLNNNDISIEKTAHNLSNFIKSKYEKVSAR